MMDLNEYINTRIEELIVLKSETLQSLKDVTKTVEELSLEEEKAIVENKMKYYSASGALAELEELKKLIR
ncbi:hypothetical protein [Aquibacillus kalidii]|uniref:hypothetical protein n=1 Tax=Aquibacillus kalidii TaxID=2762597 RepID=UPI0016466E89|nr:hypothetical protein [Aquibacillus kalidii]